MTKHSDETDAVMRSKYAPLYHHLREHTGQEWHASFAEIEKILGFSLPQSAHDYLAWWANKEEEGNTFPCARLDGGGVGDA